MSAAAQAFLVVFTSAAVAKLAGRDRFLRTLTSLPWLSPGAARLASRAVPVAELVVVALVVAVPTIGALAALALTAVFTGVVVGELVAGRRFSCGCFGGTDPAPAGPATVVRNLVVGAAAVVLYAEPYGFHTGAMLAGAGAGFLVVLLELGHGVLRRSTGPG